MTNPIGFEWTLRGNASGVIDDLATMTGGANDPAYRAFIMPEEIETDPAMRPAYVAAHASGCGLVVRGYLRRLGCEDPVLLAPYVNQKAISDVQHIADAREAEYPDYYPIPEFGDVYHLGVEEHVGIVTAATPGPGDTLIVESRDGGQGLGGLYVSKVTRVWKKERGQWWAYRGSDRRPVKAVYNLDRLVP